MLDVVRVLLRWRKPIIATMLLVVALAAVFAWTREPRYYSQASILPPQDNAAFGGISSLLQQYQISIPGGVNTPFLPTLYAAMIGSRKMGSLILDEFDLRGVFATDTEIDALETLRQRTFLKYTDEGILLVGYQDTDAKRAAEIVNSYVRHLDEFIQEVNSQRAGDTRRFVESQVERTYSDLTRAEESMRDFQRRHRTLEIDKQTEALVEIAGQLQAEIYAKETELDVLKRYARSNSNEVQNLESQLHALQNRFNRLFEDNDLSRDLEVQDERPSSKTRDAQLFPPVDAVPDLGLEYMRLLREVKVQTTLYTMLLQQLEQARIEEQKNTRVLSILDWGAPGEIPVYPQKMRMLVIAALAAFVWMAMIAVFVEKLRERREDAAEAARLAALKAEWNRMPGWFRSIERLVK